MKSKRLICTIIALNLSLCFCSVLVGCNPTNIEGNSKKQVKITNADELVNYLKGYYFYTDEESQTLQGHYLLDKNYKLTQTYSKYLCNASIPLYPEDVMVESLPYSFTFINYNEACYQKDINTAYVTNLPTDYCKEEQCHELYYKTDTLTGYATATIDRQNFNVYPQFEERQRFDEKKNYWIFPTADEFNDRKYAAKFNAVGFRLGQETINNLFKLSITDYTAPTPHVDQNRFEKLDISQNGDIVSFDIIYSDAMYSCSAKGTLNVSKIDFKYDYSEIRYEADNVIIESECTFELIALADDYTIDFNFNQQFELSSDGTM